MRELRREEMQLTTTGQGTRESAIRVTCCLWRYRVGQTQTFFKLGQVFVATSFGHKIGLGRVGYNPIHLSPIFLHTLAHKYLKQSSILSVDWKK